jgi:hypothetical protein
MQGIKSNMKDIGQSAKKLFKQIWLRLLLAVILFFLSAVVGEYYLFEQVKAHADLSVGDSTGVSMLPTYAYSILMFVFASLLRAYTVSLSLLPKPIPTEHVEQKKFLLATVVAALILIVEEYGILAFQWLCFIAVLYLDGQLESFIKGFAIFTAIVWVFIAGFLTAPLLFLLVKIIGKGSSCPRGLRGGVKRYVATVLCLDVVYLIVAIGRAFHQSVEIMLIKSAPSLTTVYLTQASQHLITMFVCIASGLIAAAAMTPTPEQDKIV